MYVSRFDREMVGVGMPALTDDADKAFRDKIADEMYQMTMRFTDKELFLMAYMSTVIQGFSWHYAMRVRDYCVTHRLAEFRHMSAQLKDMRAQYLRRLRGELKTIKADMVTAHAEGFMRLFEQDFTKLRFSLDNDIKRCYPKVTYQVMRTDAYMSRLMVRFYDVFQAEAGKAIRERMPCRDTIPDPMMQGLDAMMDGFAGHMRVKESVNVKTGLCVILNRLRVCEFNFDDDNEEGEP